MSPERRRLLEETRRRLLARRAAAREDAARCARLRALAFPEQLLFIDDPAKKKAARCTRRAGKTAMAAIYLLLEAYAAPDSTCLYLALTRKSAKRLVWRWLKRLNRDAALGLSRRAFNESELTVTLANGSVIYVGGADATDEEREKLLGGDYRLIVVDEAASFRTDLRKLVYETLDAATVDHDGTIVLVGTPGDFIGPKETRQLFFAITCDRETWPDEPATPTWSAHSWDTSANPHMAAKWAARLAKIAAEDPGFADTPEYARMYLGRWAIDVTRLVYRYRAERNAIGKLPKLERGQTWSAVISIDLGYRDASAFTVSVWREDDPLLYVARSYKRRKMTLTDVATEAKALAAIWPESKMVVDGASAQAVEELRTREKLPLLPADKANKADFIRHLNTDLATSKVKVLERECADLLEEWSTLVWDEKSATPRELATCENHCADATLYGWRYARNFLIDERDEEKPKTEAEQVQAFWDRQRDELDDLETDDAA